MVFENGLFDTQWLRAAGHSSSGGAEVGECFAAASRIRDGDGESWYAAWNDLATTVAAQATESEAAGRSVSARAAYLRASNYYRAAFTFLIGTPVDPRVVDAYRRQRDCFAAAAALTRPAVERIEIPYEGRTLPGWFLRAADDEQPRPPLIILGGYDSTAEELYFYSGPAAVARGYGCLVFDGPGQGGRCQGVHDLPDGAGRGRALRGRRALAVQPADVRLARRRARPLSGARTALSARPGG